MSGRFSTKYFVNVRFEVFTAVTVKDAAFWDLALCGFCRSQRVGGTPPLSGWIESAN
jgi:hypothetical protein